MNKRPSITTFPKESRSRMANGSMFLGDVDGRTAGARRWRDLYADLSGALGGEAHLSTVEIQRLRRAATITLLCEQMESVIATKAGSDTNLIDVYIRATSSLARVLRSLGLDISVEPGGDDDLAAVLRQFTPGDGSRTQDQALDGFIAAKGMTRPSMADDLPAKRSPTPRKTLDGG